VNRTRLLYNLNKLKHVENLKIDRKKKIQNYKKTEEESHNEINFNGMGQSDVKQNDVIIESHQCSN
jgi:hypothetical protein